MSDPAHLIPIARAWAVLIFGCLAIVYGLIHGDPAVLMGGFAVLGAEPTTRAAINGKLNGGGS